MMSEVMSEVALTPKIAAKKLASVTLSPASQYVKTHVDSSWSRHIPVLLHKTGWVLDEGAPLVIVNSAPFLLLLQPVSPRRLAVAAVAAWQLQRVHSTPALR
jgi:hypothetical protein